MKISKTRIEAFSDGVIAIIVTIIVLNIPLPNTNTAASIYDFINSIIIYFVSFLVVANFWNQHRRIFDHLEQFGNRVVWLNIIFLFLLSLVPLFTKWIILNPNAVIPAVVYGIVFLLININIDLILLNVLPSSIYKKKIHVYTRMLFMPFISLVLIFIALFNPRISIILFIGLPVASSVLNLLFDTPPNKRSRQQ